MANNNEIELSWVIDIMRRRWWIILLMVFLATGVAFGASRIMPPIYKASATLLISPSQKSESSQLNDLMASERLALTYSQLMKDRTVLDSVKAHLGLSQSTGSLADNIEVTPISDTQLIRLTVTDNNPDRAALIANTLALTFKARVEALSTDRYLATIKDAQDRSDRFQTKIDDIEGSVSDLRAQKVEKTVLMTNQQSALETLGDDYQTLQNNRQQVELAVAEATGTVMVIQPIQVRQAGVNSTASAIISVGSVKAFGDPDSNGNLPNPVLKYQDLILTPTVMETIIAETGIDDTLSQLKTRIKLEPVDNTQLIRLSITDMNANQAELVGNALVRAFIEKVKYLQAGPYADQLSGIQAELDDINDEIKTAQSEIGNLSAEIEQLTSQISHQEASLAETRTDWRESQKNLEQILITAAESSDTVAISEVAEAPRNPSQNVVLYISLAGLVGLFVGTALALLLGFLDNRIQTDKDIRKEVDLPTLGTIGRFNVNSGELIMASQPSSISADDFRVLSTHIRRLHEKQGLRTLLVTSPTPMEGKSVIVANLGLALARLGLKVVAVDADLRLPRQHKIFGLSQNDGLVHTIINGAINGCLQSTQLPGLKVLTSGGTPQNPAELLSSPSLERLLVELAGKANIVLVDCPPVLTAADASILAQIVDGVLIVLKAGHSEGQSVKSTVEMLQQAKANIIGVVLNAVSERKEGYYKYYRNAIGRK